MKTSSESLGQVSCSLRGRVVAGSYRTCRLTYTAGFYGIDDTGSIKVVMRYATDCGLPQFDRPQAPNYTTARASNGAHLQLRYDPKDNLRPWGKTIHLKVVQGFLRQGDRIDLTLGDRSGGSPGWRIQTFVEKSFELRVLVDRFATYSFERLPDSPRFRVVAGEPVRLVAVAPTLASAGEPIPVRSKLEDRWGNPVGRARKRVFPAINEPGYHTLSVKDARTGLVGWTNPILVSRGERYGRYWADLHGQSEETIGTNSIQDYFRFGRDYGFLDICAHQGNDFQITDGFWKKIQATTRKFHEPGRLVTFPGWEWSGNTALGGDRNVLFRDEGGPINRSSRALLSPGQAREPCCRTVEELFARLRDCRREVMVLPHVGGRYADLSRHDPGLEWAVEVHSAWGTFEWMLADAFARGHRLAIVANSDGHKGRPGASYPGRRHLRQLRGAHLRSGRAPYQGERLGSLPCPEGLCDHRRSHLSGRRNRGRNSDGGSAHPSVRFGSRVSHPGLWHRSHRAGGGSQRDAGGEVFSNLQRRRSFQPPQAALGGSRGAGERPAGRLERVIECSRQSD